MCVWWWCLGWVGVQECVVCVCVCEYSIFILFFPNPKQNHLSPFLRSVQVAISHHYGICKKWREENQVVKITYIYPVKSKRTLHSPSIASSKFDIQNSSRGSVAAWGTVSDRGNPPHPSLVTTPLLRPILRYSAQLKASSWHSGLSESAVNLGLPPYHSTVNTRRTSAGDRGQSVFHMRQETYV